MEIPGLRLGRGGGGSYTVTTRVISALRWAAMRAILMVHLSSGTTKITRRCPQITMCFKTERRAEAGWKSNRRRACAVSDCSFKLHRITCS